MTAELVMLVASGELDERQKAFHALMEATQASVWRMHWALWVQLPLHSRVRREEYADEMTQETFIKAYESIVHGGSRPEHFRVWIHKVGERLWLDRARHDRRTKRNAEVLPIDEMAIAAGSDPSQETIARETLGRLLELLDRIDNAKMREAFLLDLNSDLSREEIAKILDVSLETVTSYCSRVRKILQRGIMTP